VLRTHLRAGRHYLRVDVTGAAEIDADAVGALADVHRQVAASGGMLAFEHARPRVLDALRNATLLVRTGS
jgi:anti-anti-sigma regulatory factor